MTPTAESVNVSELLQAGRRLFPFRDPENSDEPSFREYQGEILMLALKRLYADGYQNVIVEGPTGIGKSPINVTVGRVVDELYDGKTFYTTPQKKLRNQLANDDVLMNHVKMLKSRRDYTCHETRKDCDRCPINRDSSQSCMDMVGCTYWNEKLKAMDYPIAALTFSMLIVDNYLPPYGEGGKPMSFDDRDLLIVDECHGLEEQVAGMHAGFVAGPWSLPPEVYMDAAKHVNYSASKFSEVENVLDELYERAYRFKMKYAGYEDLPEEIESDVEKCKEFTKKLDYARTEQADGREWTVTVSDVSHPNHNGKVKKLKLAPIYVDKFLNEFVWNRGQKKLLTTATMPYRGDPEKWCDRLGLDWDKTAVITRPMPFPEENRQIHIGTSIAPMKSGGDDEHWDEIVETIQKISMKHAGQKGLIHCTSYPRGKRLYKSLGPENAIRHKQGTDAEELLDQWYNSDKDIMISPSMTEGVDLSDDKCRWQVLLKVPYPSIGDSRVETLLYAIGDNQWYNETTFLSVMQSVGRAVRSPDDYADYYVLDDCFMEVVSNVEVPDWFFSAIDKEGV